MPPPRRRPRERDLTDRYRDGEFDSHRVEEDDDASAEHFGARSKHATQNKIERTTALRSANAGDDLSLPIGQVVQVHSLFCDVNVDGAIYRSVIRKTVNKNRLTQVVVGDRVRIKPDASQNGPGAAEAVVEQVLPRDTVLTRANSFNNERSHPIVANATQMLIVASARRPAVKWGLVDRMIIAGQSGGLRVILFLNKTDLLEDEAAREEPGDGAEEAGSPASPLTGLAHYASLGVTTLAGNVPQFAGIDNLRNVLRDQRTVLAGHSGVGKSSLIRAVQPSIDLRIGEVSEANEKGRHTTVSAKWYALDFGGVVIDTPGVKQFGLWQISRDDLADYFPDVTAGTAPPWRRQSYERILATIAKPGH